MRRSPGRATDELPDPTDDLPDGANGVQGGAAMDMRDRFPADARAASRWGSADLREWGIRPKLIAVLLIPTIAALLLGGLRMESALAASASYTRLDSLARVLPQADTLIDALQIERDLTGGLLSASPPHSLSSLGSQRSRTDAGVTTLRERLIDVDTSHDRALQGKLRSVLSGMDGLAELRRTADSGGADPTAVSADYTKIVRGLLGLTGELSAQSRDGDVTRRAVGLEALASATEAASQQRAILYRALLAGGVQGAAVTDLVAADSALQLGVAGYLTQATAAGQARVRAMMRGPAVGAVSRIVSQAGSRRSVQGLGISAAQWLSATSDEIALMGRAQADQLSSLAGRIRSLGQSARNDALTSAGIIYLILGFALLATLLVARSILRPLKALRSAALDVAYQRLPDTVRQLQDSELPDGGLGVEPIRVASTDEIGQVARAFDAVHSEAVRLAGQQALMRGNVSKMFINLSRRSQTLVERQLRLIDELEAGEQDADQLANLFRLDHLATRMRRNDENLLVLAGAEGGRRRGEPVPILDVLRAASAEVEQYSRIRFDAQPGFALAGAAVNDVVHLLAELVENATTFSPPGTSVWLRSHSLGAGGALMIEVEDNGIGMTAAELDAANEKLASASGMDVSMSRLMGLLVVARLAQRHDVHVQLRAAPSSGLTALVRLAAGLVTVPGTIPAPAAVAAVGVASAGTAESAPIFDALQSEWFARRGRPRPGGARRESSPPAANWQSPGDEGWQAAAELGNPATQPDMFTAAGLPMRVPGHNLIPGTAPGPGMRAAARPPSEPATHRDPRQSRTLSSYQQGVHRARVAGQASARHGEPVAAGLDEQQVRP